MGVRNAVKYYDSSVDDVKEWLDEKCGKFHQLIRTSECRLNAPIYIFLEHTPSEAFEDPEVLDLIEKACEKEQVRLKLYVQWGLMGRTTVDAGNAELPLRTVFVFAEEYCLTYDPLPVPNSSRR